MPWWKKKARDRRRAERATETEMAEFLDPYHDRSMITEDEQAVVQPGKILSNLHERMERYAIDPLIDVAVEEFVDVTEAAVMVRLGFGPMLIASTAEWAAELLYRELPDHWAGHPIPPEFDLVEQVGDGRLALEPRLQAIGRDIFNAAVAQPPVEDSDRADELAALVPADLVDVGDVCQVFVTVLMLYLTKIAYAAQARETQGE